MIVGICAPIAVTPLTPWLDVTAGTRLPEGMGGTPVVALVRGLLERGHRVVIFTLDRSVSDEVVLAGERLKICIGPYRHAHRARDLFRTEREYLVSAIRRERPELVHAHWTYEFALAALDSGRPTVVTAHDAPLQVLRHIGDAYRAARLLMAWKVARRAEHLTAVSDYIGGHFRKVLRYSHLISVVPNAVPDELFELGASRGRSREANGVAIATVLNGWGQLKNASVALKAFGELRRRMPQARLLMFGVDYGRGETAQRWARARGLAEGVEFAGEVAYEQLHRRLACEADILLHPSREESFSMAVAEAMALRLAVIGGARAGAVPSLLEDGRVGELADVTSTKSVAAALLKLANNRALREELGDAAGQSARSRFRTAIVVDQYEAIYRTVC
jgi:glycosyltransferase involved in cell wall biosynthesis